MITTTAAGSPVLVLRRSCSGSEHLLLPGRKEEEAELWIRVRTNILGCPTSCHDSEQNRAKSESGSESSVYDRSNSDAYVVKKAGT